MKISDQTTFSTFSTFYKTTDSLDDKYIVLNTEDGKTVKLRYYSRMKGIFLQTLGYAATVELNKKQMYVNKAHLLKIVSRL